MRWNIARTIGERIAKQVRTFRNRQSHFSELVWSEATQSCRFCASSDSNLLSVSGYFRTNQIKAAACSFGLLRPCSQCSRVRGFPPALNSKK